MYGTEIAFIRQLYRSETVPLHVPLFSGNEGKYLDICLKTAFVASEGQFVDRFERDVADYTGAKSAVACSSGTGALFTALLVAGVKEGDEVLTQPLTYVATCNAIGYTGATPVFIDVDPDTLGMSPAATRRWLENNAHIVGDECFDKGSGRRVRACVPVHTFGHPVHIEEMAALCEEWHIELVEDAAESMGSLYKGRHTGTFGRCGALSFNGNKTITTGGGGMVLLRDPEDGLLARHLTTQAKLPHRWEFLHDRTGYNLRMPNLNAALGCAQLERLEQFVENKRATAQQYAAFFRDKEGMRFFTEPEGCRSNYWLNVLLLEDRPSCQAFLQETNDAGIQTRPAWELMPRLEMFKHCPTGGIPNAISLSDRIVCLPSGVRV